MATWSGSEVKQFVISFSCETDSENMAISWPT